MKQNALEDLLAAQLDDHGLLELFERQARFDPVRKWRFDFFCRSHNLAVEVEGGTFIAGRHSRGAGMREDMEKYNAAALLGIKVLRFDALMVEPAKSHRRRKLTGKAWRRWLLEGSALMTIRRALDLPTTRKRPSKRA